MGTFNSWDDALHAGQVFKGSNRFIVCNSNILGAPCIVKMGVFRSNARIIKTSGDGINRCNLAVIILQE